MTTPVHHRRRINIIIIRFLPTVYYDNIYYYYYYLLGTCDNKAQQIGLVKLQQLSPSLFDIIFYYSHNIIIIIIK